MQTRYENWTNGLNGDWCVSRQRFFGVPFPVWYPIGDRRPRRLRRARSPPREDQLPIDPSTDVPTGYRAEQRGAAGRLRRRSRRHGHLGDLVALAADRLRLAGRSGSVRADVPDGPAAAGARHHPHLAVRHGAARAPRARLAAVDATPRSPAGCSIPIARRCRSRRATSSRRWRCSRSTAPTACATGRRAAGRAPTRRSTPNQMKVGRRLAIKLLNASKFALASAEPQGAITAPVDRAMLRNLAALVDEATRGLRGLRLRARAAAHRDVLLALLRRLPRAGEGPPLRRAGRRRRRRRRTPR